MEKITYQAMQERGILLNANESPYPLSESIQEEIKSLISTIPFHRYPDDSAKALCEAYAKYLGVSSDQVLAGNGSDEMIGLLIGLTISKGKKVYTLDPDFSMYDYYTSMHDGQMVKYSCDLDQPFDVEDFIEKGREEKVDMILFSNPNNPTGRSISQNDIIKILEAYPRNLVVIDEAYGEFADTSMLPYLNEYRNLCILRTMSKAFGMAALRCGFLITCASTMARIAPFKVPYNVNALTQAIAVKLLSHTEEMQANIETLKVSRTYVYEQVQAMNLDDFILYPSQANYLYGKTHQKQIFLDALAQADIAIRDYSGSEFFRISIGTSDENESVLQVIRNVFVKQEELV